MGLGTRIYFHSWSHRSMSPHTRLDAVRSLAQTVRRSVLPNNNERHILFRMQTHSLRNIT
jgi:hypothetical protein